MKKNECDLAKYLKRNRYNYLLLLPCVIYFIVFKYVPMYGVIIAFKDFSFRKGIMGSDWIGFEHFRYMFGLDDFFQVFKNSLTLSGLKILFGFPAPIILALFLNEIRHPGFKRSLQTLIYLPHFISWVVLGGILLNFLSPSWGIINAFIKNLGGDPIFFMAEERFFRPIVVISSIWKEAGWGTIIYLAAITGISPELYEAAYVDGANRIKQTWHITLPGIKTTVIILFILQIGKMMSNGFEQIFVLQNSMNLSVSEVFETYVYRIGLLGGRFSFATAVGLFTSAIGMIMLIATNQLAKAMGEEGLY